MYLYKCPRCGEYAGVKKDDGFIYCTCGFKFDMSGFCLNNECSMDNIKKGEQKPIRLNLGCGNKPLKGWINIDIDSALHTDGYSDEIGSTCLFQHNDNSVDEIYASHVLDHLSRKNELDNTLAEWYRVLKPGGILRVAVSDFEKTVKMYDNGMDLEQLWGAIVGGHKTEYDKHGCIFDYNVLRRYLEKHGFVDVKRYDWRDFLPKGFEDNSCAAIPKYDPDGYLISLNVIAKKVILT